MKEIFNKVLFMICLGTIHKFKINIEIYAYIYIDNSFKL